MNNILIIGNGSREHCIADILSNYEKNNVYVLNGNPGMYYFNPRIKLVNNIDIYNYYDISEFCINENIYYVIIGGEEHLAKGITEYLEYKHICVIGPSKIGAKLESSKYYAKQFMNSVGIPTADYQVYNYDDLVNYIYKLKNDLITKYNGVYNLNNIISKMVIKLDGLAFGKGVYLPNTIEEMESVLTELNNNSNLNKLTDKIIVEKRLNGVEFSMMCFCDGEDTLFMPHSKDYKKIGENDTGLNTGGMGSISNVKIVDDKHLVLIKDKIKSYVLKTKYKGILYAGLLVENHNTDNPNVYVLEFNCRLGDPETQSVLQHFTPKVLTKIFECISNSTLCNIKDDVYKILNNDKNMYLTFVLSHNLYPVSKAKEPFQIDLENINNVARTYLNNPKIYTSNIFNNKNDIKSEHNEKSERNENGLYFSNGGRILSITSNCTTYINNISSNYSLAYKQLLKNYYNFNNCLSKINYTNIYYRHDIGHDIILDYILNNDKHNIYDVSNYYNNNNNIQYNVFNNLNKYNLTFLCSNNCTSGLNTIFYFISNIIKRNSYFENNLNLKKLFNIILENTSPNSNLNYDLSFINNINIITNNDDAGVLNLKEKYLEFIVNLLSTKEFNNDLNNSKFMELVYNCFDKYVHIIIINSKLYSKNTYNKYLLDELIKLNTHYIFLLGYMKIIPTSIINVFKNRIFNIHPSLLPKYKNMMDLNIHKKVIENKDTISGCTLHIVEEKVDAGSILMQKTVLLNDLIDTNDLNEYTPLLLKKYIQSEESNLIFNFIQTLPLYDYISINQLPENNINQILTYRSSGVDIDMGNLFIDIIKKNLKENKLQNANIIGGFSGTYKLSDGSKLLATTDGVGTKLELARNYNHLDNIGIDLVAMSVNDLLITGAKPLFFLDYYAINKLDLQVGEKVIKSIIEGCNQSNMILLGGETAEMPLVYTRDKFDLAGFCVGLLEKNQIEYPLKEKINENDILFMLPSNGVHSNGYSLINKILTNSKTKVYNFENTNYSSNVDVINDLLKPTYIYYNEIQKLKEVFGTHLLGMAHITGGGLVDNIPRILNKNQSFKLTKKWKVPDVFKFIYKNSTMTLDDMYKTYNLGIGIVFIVSQNYPNNEKQQIYKNLEIGRVINNSSPLLFDDLL